MVRRFAALAAAILIGLAASAPGGAGAEIVWKQDTAGQVMLKDYVERANECLAYYGERPVNSLFEMYSRFAVFGITAEDGAMIPEGVEMTCRLYTDSLDLLQIRVSQAERFPAIAAAFLRAADPELTPEAALKEPQALMRKAAEKPDQGFEEQIEELNGTATRAYYAYWPDQYHDGVNWLQVTIVFPLKEYWGEAGIAEGAPAETRGPEWMEDADPEYEGYASEDDYTHFEVFATATPEPDSAAKEYDPYWD